VTYNICYNYDVRRYVTLVDCDHIVLQAVEMGTSRLFMVGLSLLSTFYFLQKNTRMLL